MHSQGQERVKIFYGWWVVLASAVGLFLCYGPIVTFTFGVFFNSLVHEFNWSRAEISLSYSLSMLAFGVAQPFVGRLVDRVGSRKVILPAALIFGVCFVSLYFLSSRVGHFYAVYIAMGLVGGGTTSMVYFKVLTRWFSRKRGLVIGLALVGNGLSAFVMPSLTQALIDWAGWREAYVLIGLMVMGITIPLVMLLLAESPESRGLLPDGDSVSDTFSSAGSPKQQQQETGGLSALRTPAFWFMAPAFLLVSMSLVGTLTHLVPMLTDRGIATQSAAFAASVLGGATLIGRIGIGYLLDRIQAPRVAVSLFVTAASGVLILWTGAAGSLAFVGAFLVGIGSSFDSIIPYMVSRYFSLPAFAETYGYVVAVNVAGWMAGPLIMGVSFDYSGSYDWVLVGFLVCMLTAATLMFFLGYYYRDSKRGSQSP